jgi:hypothetical protein
MDAVEPTVIEQPVSGSAASGESGAQDDSGGLVIDILAKRPCGPGPDGEIVVCPPDPDEHRPNASAPAPVSPEAGFRAETSLAPSVTAAARGQTDRQTGAHRLMIDLRIEF